MNIKLVKGLEPPTYGLQIRCSTVELHQLIDKGKDILFQYFFQELIFEYSTTVVES